MPRYEFKQGTSNKFWEIELKGNSYTTTYGKIGTDGKSTTKDYPDAAKAQKEYEKAIKSKTKKGYQLAGEGGDAGGGDGGKQPLIGLEKESAIRSHTKKFIFRTVKAYKEKPGLSMAAKGVAYRVAFEGYGSENSGSIDDFVALLGKVAADKNADKLEGLIIGCWDEEMGGGTSSARVVQFLVENADSFPNMQALFIGDVDSEECEMSWIEQADYAPLVDAFPKLEHLRIRGGTGCGKLASDTLRSLTVQTMVPSSALQNICSGKLPEVEHLELWLGTDEYGGNGTVDDLLPLLSGKSFPKLRYLGLRNAQIADDVAVALSDAPIVERLDTLDLSLGTLGDRGVEALVASPAVAKLKRLDIHHHYAGADAIKKLKALKIPTLNADAGDVEIDEDYRYVRVGE